MENKREKFSSGVTVFLATLSSAVGLGNIWMFPYVTGRNGGAAFIIIYIVCVMLVGIPILLSEFSVGRNTRKNVYGAIGAITNKKAFKAMGILALVATYFMIFFYSVVVGWVYSYLFKALGSSFINVNTTQVQEIFYNTTLGPIAPIVWQIISILVVASILVLGIKDGIEKVAKTLMPIFFGLLLICVVRSLSLPGALEGVSFLLKPDFSKIGFGVFISALGLAFFKLSVGSGTMITYGSYFNDDNNMPSTAIRVALSDIVVSMLAGLAIFPAVFSFGLEPSSGPGLLFNIIPLIFSKLPAGRILIIVFFFLASIIGTMAMLSMLEVAIAFFTEELKVSRVRALVINIIIADGFGALAALSSNGDSILGGIKILGKGFFDFFEGTVSKVLLPVNSFIFVILCGYFINKNLIKNELTNNGDLYNGKLVSFIIFLIKYITPILIILVFVSSFI